MLRRSALIATLSAFMILLFAGASLAADPKVLDVNTANAEELMTVKGVGEKTAAKIIVEREKNGPFASIEALGDRVKGVGDKTVANFKAAGWVAGGAKPSPEGVKTPKGK